MKRDDTMLPWEDNTVVSAASTFQQSKLLLSIWHSEILFVWKAVLSEDFSTDVETAAEITVLDREGKLLYQFVYSAFGNSLNTQFHSFHSKGC